MLKNIRKITAIVISLILAGSYALPVMASQADPLPGENALIRNASDAAPEEICAQEFSDDDIPSCDIQSETVIENGPENDQETNSQNEHTNNSGKNSGNLEGEISVIRSGDLVFFHETADYDEVKDRIMDTGTLEEEAALGSRAYFDDIEKYSSYTYYNRMDENMKYAWDRLTTLGNYYINNKADMYESTQVAYTDYICVGDLTGDDVLTLYNIWCRNNPQYYFLLSGCSTMSRNGQTYIAPMAYLRFADGAERWDTTQMLFDKVKSMASEVSGEADDYSKLVKAHDLICKNVVYNTAGADNIALGDFEFTQSCYSTFTMGTTVCAGYAAGYAMLCNYCDVETAVVVSDTHAWNLVRLGGRYYNVDTTWDDGKKINYNYFLKSDYSVRSGNPDHQPRSGMIDFASFTPRAGSDSSSSSSPACPDMPGAAAAAPVISVERGTQCDYITLTSTTEGAKIYFSLDGNDPSTGNTKAFLYTGRVGVRGRVRAIATAEGYYDSPVTEKRLSYEIAYELNEGTNSPENPPHYHEDDPDITLKDPQRSGYKFKGWFTDKAMTESISVIKCADAKDMTLYALWDYDQSSGPGPDSGTGLDGEIGLDPDKKPDNGSDDQPADTDAGDSNEASLNINGYRFRQSGYRIEDGVYKSYYYVLDVFYYTGFTYAGKAIKPTVYVYDELKGKWLSKGKSFKVSYTANRNASSKARIRVKGAGSYKGFDTASCSGTMYFTIYPITFNNSNLLIPDYSVAYKEGKLIKTPPKEVYLGSVKLNKKDFKVEYTGKAAEWVSGNMILKNAENPYMAKGSYEVKLSTGKSGNILGSRSVIMTISDKQPVSKLKIKYTKQNAYSGYRVRPGVDVYLKDTLLTEAKDYSVSYHNNFNKGTGIIVVSGMGDYTGVAVKKFKIR